MNNITDIDLECDNCGISESAGIRLYFDKSTGGYSCPECKKASKLNRGKKSDKENEE